MKKTIKVLGNLNRDRKSKVPLLIIAMAAVIGFSFAACKKSLEGTTWEQSDGGDHLSLTFSSPPNVILADGPHKMEATYTISGNKVTITIGDETVTGTISGNKLSLSEDGDIVSTFTKKNVAVSKSGGGGPTSVVKKYYAALAKGDAKTIGEVMTAKGAENLTPFMSKAKDHVTALGKITKTEEDIDGDSGVVKVTFSNGATEEIDVKKVNGKWKISEWDSGF